MSDCQAFLNPQTGRAVKMDSETHARLYRYGFKVPMPARYTNAKFIRRKHKEIPTPKKKTPTMSSPVISVDPEIISPSVIRRDPVISSPTYGFIEHSYPVSFDIIRPVSNNPRDIKKIPKKSQYAPYTVIRSNETIYGSKPFKIVTDRFGKLYTVPRIMH